jgi:hypothetical protein
MSSFHAFLIALALGLACAQPAFAQGSTTPPGGPLTPPDALPDLVVTSVQASAICTPQGNITATIVAVVKNLGPKATIDLSGITWQIILSAGWSASDGKGYLETNPPPKTVTPYAGGPMKLAPGETWKGTMSIAGITKYITKKGNTKPGRYTFLVLADPYGKIPESNENNNAKASGHVDDPCFKLAR